MTLQGSKSEGTDVHSNTASTIGISRDQAKVPAQLYSLLMGELVSLGKYYRSTFFPFSSSRLANKFTHRATPIIRE